MSIVLDCYLLNGIIVRRAEDEGARYSIMRITAGVDGRLTLTIAGISTGICPICARITPVFTVHIAALVTFKFVDNVSDECK